MFIAARFTNMGRYLKISQGILLNICGQIHLFSKILLWILQPYQKEYIYFFVNYVVAAFTTCLKQFSGALRELRQATYGPRTANLIFLDPAELLTVNLMFMGPCVVNIY
jgi:uncharacterized membrane protein